MSAARVSVADLEFAADWLSHYDGDPEDDGPNVTAAKRMIAWLDAEIARREEDQRVRQIVRDLAEKGQRVTEAQARTALRRTLAKVSAAAAS